MRSSIGKIVALIVTGFGIGWLAGLSVSPVVSIVITSVTGSVATIVAALSGVKDELLDKDIPLNTVRRILKGVTPVPLGWLVAGLIAGSIVGILVRNYNKLGIDQSTILTNEISMWTKYGLDEKTVARRLFEAKYGDKGWLGGDLQAEIDMWVNAGELDKKQVAQTLLASTYPAGSTQMSRSNSEAATLPDLEILGFSVLRAAKGTANVSPLCDAAQNRSGEALRDYITSGAITNTQIISLTSAISDNQTLQEVMKFLCYAG